MVRPRALIHSAWFDFACARLGGTESVDQMLGRELYRLSLYADLVPVVSTHVPLRIYRTAPFVREDGQLIRLWIYFVLAANEAVELQHIEAVEEICGAEARRNDFEPRIEASSHEGRSSFVTSSGKFVCIRG